MRTLLDLFVTAVRLHPLRLALGTFAIVHAALLALVFVIGRSDPGLNVNGIVLGWIASFLFWTALHWAWHRTDARRQQEQV